MTRSLHVRGGRLRGGKRAALGLIAGLGVFLAEATAEDLVLPNLVRNPSFESSLSGWSPYGACTFQRVKGGFHGAFSLEVHGPSNLTPFGAQDGTPWVSNSGQKGTQFRASAWVRSPGHSGQALMRIRESKNGAQVGLSTYASVKLSREWQLLVSQYVTTSAGSQLELQIVDQPVARAEVFRADNITILAVPSEKLLEEWRKRTPMPSPPAGDLS